MKLPSWSSFGFWSFVVFFSFVVIESAKININYDTFNDDDDDAWIDPYDMLNYDPTTKRMRKSTESESYSNVPTKRREFNSKSCNVPKCPDEHECLKKLHILEKEFDEQKSKSTATFSKPVCLPVFKRFLSKLLKETSKLGLPDDGITAMHYDAEVKLSKQSLAEIQKLLNDEDGWTTGAIDEALSQILIKFKLHDYEAWKWRFEDTFHVDADTVLEVSLIVLIIVSIICTQLWSVVSWLVQFRRMFAVCFFISLIWNWFHLYMLAFAEHKKNIVQVESFNDKCTGLKQLNWQDGLSEWYRRTWTLQDDPCKKYYEVLVVNPILLVPPTKALTVTITNFITDPLKHIGEGIGEFLKALLKDLPVTLQIPVLIIITLAILIFMYGSAQAAIHQAARFPRLGWRQDPPPPAIGQRQNPQLREHEEPWEGGDAPQPLLMRQGNRGNHVGNQGGQGFRDANAPQNKDRSMEIHQEFSAIPKRTPVENVQATGNTFTDDETDSQQQTREVDSGAKVDEEVKVEEKEKNASSVDKKDQKETESPDRSEPVTNVPSSPIDVKTVGADQGNEEASADLPDEEECFSFKLPVQESQN